MPLLVTDYSWSQSPSTVHISVPLKGAAASKVDIVSTDDYLKLSFPPFLFEAFLFEPVDDRRSSAKIGNGAALLTLTKRSHAHWQSLSIHTYDKEQKKEMREKALLAFQLKLEKQSKSRAEKKQSHNKYTLETMMRLEQDDRERIQKIKEDERARTTAELQAWQLQQQEALERDKQRAAAAAVQLPAQQHPAKTIKAYKERAGCSQSASRESPALPPTPPPPLPLPLPLPPRSSGNIKVNFTPRVFPTALRESRAAEEEEWLRKQAAARRTIGRGHPQLHELREEEKDPDWLKEKGDKCFVAGNFQGAINAYSLALRLNPRIPALYSNRAACFLKTKKLHKAVEDSSQALQLLTPPVPANAAARARAHARRGAAFCQLQLLAEGLQDFQAALRIRPEDAALQADARSIRTLLQSSGAPSTS